MVARLALLEFDGAKPRVDLRLNGRPMRMAIDSGAETSMLTGDGAAALGLAPGPTRRRVAGLAGTADYGVVRVARIEFAGETVRGLDLPIIPLAALTRIDGLIGADLLAAYLVALDFSTRQLTLYRPRGCAHVSPPWPATPLAWTGAEALPIVRAALDGRPLTALIDTGTNISAISAAAAGLTPADLRSDRSTQSFGAGGTSLPGRMHRFSRLSLGSLTLANPTLRVVTLDPALPFDMILGMDVLRGRRLWLDYAGRRTFVGER